MKIKALSLWQPWASLIAVGAKKYETRSWATNYRGSLLICAARKWPPYPGFALIDQPGMLRSLAPDGGRIRIPRGAAVAIVDLINCAPAGVVAQMLEPHGLEIRFGDFTPGRWAWALDNVRPIDPFPVTGRQGLFEVEVPDDLMNSNPRPCPA